MSDERLDRELGEIFRAAADVQLPDSLVDRVASIPAGRPPRRSGVAGLSRFGTAVATVLAIVVLVVGAALYGAWRLGPTVARPVVSLAPGTFGPTGSMTVGRAGHTATTLKNGRVLIAGGQGASNSYLASAELYDPATGTFSATGSMATARMDQTATLLADGRVLVTGGLAASGYLASAEVYDPATGKFARTGSMAGTRNGQTATLLDDGRVLIAGGFRGHTDPGIAYDVPETLSSAELYDPRTGTFQPTGSMTAARGGHTATLLADGRVLVAGGSFASRAIGDFTSGAAELYDPATGTFSPTGSMAHHRSDQTATLLSDGRVLIVGGRGRNVSGSGDITLASAELYDPRTGTFSSTGSMTVPRRGPTATMLHDGRVLLAGGSNDTSTAGLTAELYDPRAGDFTATGPMTASRFGHAAALLADGRVLLTGGNGPTTPTNATLASAELFEP